MACREQRRVEVELADRRGGEHADEKVLGLGARPDDRGQRVQHAGQRLARARARARVRVRARARVRARVRARAGELGRLLVARRAQLGELGLGWG